MKPSNRYIVLILALVLAALLIGALAGYVFSRYQNPPHEAVSPAKGAAGDGRTVLYWYDPMVPEQKFDKPGKSPFMDMQLVPKYKDEAAADAGVTISPQVMQNLGIRLAQAEMLTFGDELAAVGRIEADERRFHVVQTRVPGFVEKLHVRAIGDPVAKGQKLAEVYAPELLAAQQEYLALLDYDGVGALDGLGKSAMGRLQLLGMSQGEIAAITRSRKPRERFGIYAPASGVLTELGVREGGQLMPGASLMQISDLSSVWLLAEVPERDAGRVRLGASARLVLQGMPNETFSGRVGYIYPTLDTVARTLRVRIELANRDGDLRPGMYGSVTLSGKTYEALGVPSESVIATGKRKVVIVKEAGGFRPVDVTAGQEKAGQTEILSGLKAGEQVVVSGQFLIDSEASLSGVLSRLSQQPTQDDPHAGHVMEAQDMETHDHSNMPPAAMPQKDMQHGDMQHGAGLKGEQP
jgi:Cu(I)/Ag(I) efflux system membrane fusion protein